MTSASPAGSTVGGAVGGPSFSVVVPAHDEGAVIDRCLAALLAQAAPGEVEVVVAASACTDDTAARAAAHGRDVRVVEVEQPGKVAAITAGDAAATAFPRVYLDADVVLTTTAARATAAALGEGRAMAAAPRPEIVGEGGSRVVVWHHRAFTALPVVREGYVGSGVYALSRAGHARAFPLPDLIADDEYVRKMFTPAERTTVAATFEMRPPRTVGAYVRRALRARVGNVELARSGIALASQEGAPRGGVRALLPMLRDRRMWVPVASFVALTALVRARVALHGDAPVGWNRDLTSRAPVAGRARDRPPLSPAGAGAGPRPARLAPRPGPGRAGPAGGRPPPPT